MSKELDGKVAVITGAAQGLGRLHAIELARQGAKVVVNDLGVAIDGSGRDEGPANEVVDEIKSAGGKAVAHFGDVADWDSSKALIQTAIDHFGGLDILINNAGFTRDSTIFKMSEDEFDSVVRVHLKGHFCTSKFACEYWRNKSKQEGGDLAVLTPERVDMLTLVLVGSSETRRVTHGGGLWVYTPRGYRGRSEDDLEVSA